MLLFAGFVLASPAQAAKWEMASEWSDVDVESIRRGSDGLVYYTVGDEFGDYSAAVDCSQRIMYEVESTGLRSDGAIKPGSDFAQEADFVCARA